MVGFVSYGGVSWTMENDEGPECPLCGHINPAVRREGMLEVKCKNCGTHFECEAEQIWHWSSLRPEEA